MTMETRTFSGILAIMLILLLGCCGIATASSKDSQQSPDESLASAYARFGFSLYSELCSEKENTGKNIFISPASIAFALGMTYNGADKETREAMGRVLGVNGMTLENFDRNNRELLDSLKGSEPGFELAIANSLWCSKNVRITPDFIKKVKESFRAEVKNELSAAAINGWVSSATKGKIQRLLDNLSDDVVMVLVNAVYFKGTWTYTFDKKKTLDRDFFLMNGSTKKFPMMSREGKFNYLHGDGFQAVSLPYGKKRLSMYVFLPDQNNGLPEFLKKLNAKNWTQWMAGFRSTEGEILLPRFKCEYTVELKKALTALGMGVAFDGEKADFSKICKEKIWIGKVIHKTFVEVNEEGTEAAAATAVVMMKSMAAKTERFSMHIDHPFFFAILDSKTGSLLFMGSIVEPTR
jgi:serine protease inhibitor